MCRVHTHHFGDVAYHVGLGPFSGVIIKINFIALESIVEFGSHNCILKDFLVTGINEISFLRDCESNKCDAFSVVVEENIRMSAKREEIRLLNS